MNPKDLFEHIHGKAGLFITYANFLKFYALSKKIVPYEALDTERSYLNLEADEFIELVFRVVEYIYNPKSYADEVADGPQQVNAMMEEDVLTQYKHNMQVILNVPIKDGQESQEVKLLDAEEIEQVDDVQNLWQYLPEPRMLPNHA